MNQLAKFVVDVATGEQEAGLEVGPINEFARAGGIARAANLSQDRRKKIALKAAQARWGKCKMLTEEKTGV